MYIERPVLHAGDRGPGAWGVPWRQHVRLHCASPRTQNPVRVHKRPNES